MKREGTNLYIDQKVFKEFEKSIKGTGLSVSRMVELMMRVSISKEGKQLENVFDALFEFKKKVDGK